MLRLKRILVEKKQKLCGHARVMHKFGCSGAGCTPRCTAGRLAESKRGQRWHFLLKSRAATRPFSPSNKAVQLDGNEELKDAKRASARVPVPRAGEGTKDKNQRKRAGAPSTAQFAVQGRRKRWDYTVRPNASQEKDVRTNHQRHERCGSAGKETRYLYCKPISSFNRSARGAPGHPTPQETRKVT